MYIKLNYNCSAFSSVKIKNYVVHTNDAITKHMLSNQKWYDWLTDRVAAVGRCYVLALELQKVPSKTANKFSILNHRWAKFGMGNGYTDCSIELCINN